MKKGFSGSSKKRMGSSSKSSSSGRKPLFRSSSRPKVKSERASSSGSFLKDKIRRKRDSSFEKPEHDPGPKYRGESYSGDNSGEEYTDSSQSTGGGRGCCSGITGFLSLLAVLAAVVIIVFLAKCL